MNPTIPPIISATDTTTPIPKSRNIAYRYPYPYMEVGESFIVPEQKRTSAFTAARYWGLQQRPHRVFSGRKIAPGEVRIWRVT